MSVVGKYTGSARKLAMDVETTQVYRRSSTERCRLSPGGSKDLVRFRTQIHIIYFLIRRLTVDLW